MRLVISISGRNWLRILNYSYPWSQRRPISHFLWVELNSSIVLLHALNVHALHVVMVLRTLFPTSGIIYVCLMRLIVFLFESFVIIRVSMNARKPWSILRVTFVLWNNVLSSGVTEIWIHLITHWHGLWKVSRSAARIMAEVIWFSNTFLI